MLLPAGDDIVAVLGNHPVEFRDFVRGVLEVCVHGDDDIALCRRESLIEGGGLAVVAAEGDAADGGILGREFTDPVPGIVGGSVVHHQDLVGETIFFHHPVDPGGEFRQGFGLVKEGNDD